MGQGPATSAIIDIGSGGDVDGPTVLASWTATVVRTLTERGVDGARLAQEAGIDRAAFDVDGADGACRPAPSSWPGRCGRRAAASRPSSAAT